MHEVEKKLRAILEALGKVETKGTSTVIMGNCLIGLQSLVDGELKEALDGQDKTN